MESPDNQVLKEAVEQAVCIKGTPNQIAICQCPICTEERQSGQTADKVLVTDEHLRGWGEITNIVWFMCPVCNNKSVAVTPYDGLLGRYCLNEPCRVEVVIDSEELKQWIAKKEGRA